VIEGEKKYEVYLFVPRLWLCLLFAVVLSGTAAAQSASKPIIILVGPPSSGKTTQSEMIQKQYSFAVITREQLMKDDPVCAGSAENARH
jgi:hypothetical protein